MPDIPIFILQCLEEVTHHPLILASQLPNGEIFYTLKEAQILIERWRREYNTVRPHSALGYRPPAPEATQVMPRDPGSAMLRQDLWLDLAPILT